MKGFHTLIILCDGEGCDHDIQYVRNINSKPLITQATAQAKREGWVVVQRDTKKCYCPECFKKRRFLISNELSDFLQKE